MIAIGVDPDGTNINVGCGATDLRALQQLVREEHLDLGVAFDGDGDRMLAVDGNGDAARRRPDPRRSSPLDLEVDLVVVTTMTNLGFHRLMAERGVRVLTTDVGDRYVLEALKREGGVLGGEQSGHIIYLDGPRHRRRPRRCAAALRRAPGPDARRGRRGDGALPAGEGERPRLAGGSIGDDVRHEVDRVNDELAGRGRVLVRPSGTEPVIRVLAEAETEEEAADLCASITALVERELG